MQVYKGITMMTNKEFEEFYSSSYRKVYNYFYYLTMNHHISEDLTSITFLKFFSNMNTFDEKLSSKLTFTLRIAKNVAIDYYRSNKDCEELVDNDKELYEFESNLVDRMILNDILSRLPQRDRMIIYYKYYLDMKSDEIAKIMGISVTNVTTLCSRALKKVKKFSEKV